MNLTDAMRIIEQRTNKLIDSLPMIVETEALKYAKQNFENQSWEGQKWPERKNKKSNKPLLVDTGILRNSLNGAQTSVDGNTVTVKISSDVPYAGAHNFGFEGDVAQNIGEHQRRSRKGTEYFVKAYRRNIKLRIPKRQFIGKNDELEDNIKREIRKQMNQILKGL